MKAQIQLLAVASVLALATGPARGGGIVINSPNKALHSPASVTHDLACVTLKSRTVKPPCTSPVFGVPVHPYCYPGPLYTGVYRPFAYVVDDVEPRRPVNTQEWDFYQSGRDWGQDLRRAVTTWETFVYHVKSYIAKAAPALRAEFRRGFIESYGLNAEAAFDKAMQTAVAAAQPIPSSGPKVIVVAPKTSPASD